MSIPPVWGAGGHGGPRGGYWLRSASQQGSYNRSHLDTEGPGLGSLGTRPCPGLCVGLWVPQDALGTKGMLGTLGPLGMQDAQDTVGRQRVPSCCHPCPVNTTVLDPPPPQMALSSLSPVPQLCPSHVPKVTRDC